MSKTITSAEYNAWLEHPLTKGLKRSFQQSITDPENQPSQYGTVTLEMYEALEKQRDELLAALKEATNPNGCAWHPDKFAKLIANAEGESITGTIKCAAGCGNDVPVMAKDEGYDHICKNCGVTYTYAAEDCMSAARLNAIDTSECVKEQA